ncbi:MAG: hypothetical protein K0R99_2999 [Microbacterium sp.]|jgi:hypothetical protein|nr:hypothetical protein [Microbacterium sp.]
MRIESDRVGYFSGAGFTRTPPPGRGSNFEQFDFTDEVGEFRVSPVT